MAGRAVGSQFGSIGGIASAVAVSKMKSDLDYEITFRNVVVRDKQGNIVCTVVG
jgi:hypothetical protein